MRSFIVIAAVLAVANGQLIVGGAVAAGGATQYHAQDELGQYSYGYAGGPSSKSESKTADGVVRGAYSYIDGNGLVQSVNYVADPINGFRVAATNLPVGPAPAQAQLVAAGPIPVARAAIAHPQLIAQPRHIIAGHAVAHHVIGNPTYVASAAPLNNGAVHVASLPIAPQDTPEVQAARAAHFAAKLG